MISAHLRKIGYTAGEWQLILNTDAKYRTWTKKVSDTLVFQVDEEQHPVGTSGGFKSNFFFLAHESLPEEIQINSALWLLDVEERFKNKKHVT